MTLQKREGRGMSFNFGDMIEAVEAAHAIVY